MRYKNYNYWLLVPMAIGIGLLVLLACSQQKEDHTHVRPLADTVGFAQYGWQMDSIMERIERMKNQNPKIPLFHYKGNPKVVICPHDDYAYAGILYQAAIQNIRAKTIILFGVAHKARLMNLENQIVFDSYKYWKGPYGNVKVSEIREDLIKILPHQIFQINDSMQRMEHSVEAIIPYLQYYNRNVEIVSILVPYMSFEKIKEISEPLAKALQSIVDQRAWQWDKDYAIVISNDAVHYGDEDWGGKNFALFGTDSLGYEQALDHETEIMHTLEGNLDPHKLKAFCTFTVEENDFREYKWTWCGRYSIPLGLLTAYNLQNLLELEPLYGSIIGYATSIDHPHIQVNDLHMGATAPANEHHWVGYAAVGYK